MQWFEFVRRSVNFMFPVDIEYSLLLCIWQWRYFAAALEFKELIASTAHSFSACNNEQIQLLPQFHILDWSIEVKFGVLV